VSTHLRPEELVDLAEGTRAEASAPHLATCERCRRLLDELRTTMAAMEEESVPEPSPLFWDHLQQRVVAAVAAEGTPARFPRLAWLARPRVLVPAGALVAAVLAVAVSLGLQVSPPPLPPSPTDRPVQVASAPSDAPDASSRLELLNDSLAADDPSLQLVADLTAGMDSSAAGDAGLAVRGSAEHAVTHLNAAELSELQRLLRQELSKSGA
jgi:hypothetical protein